MPTYYRPMKTAEDWQALVADPDKHWREGYSARTLAYCWHEAMGVPAEIDRALRAFEPFRGIELLLGLPEHQVPLPGGVRPSQSDIWCLARQGDSLVSMTIEGKVDETLRPTVGEWLAEGSPGKDTPGCPPPRGHPRPCRLDLTGGFRATNSRQWVSLMGRPLPTAGVGCPVAQPVGQLSGDQLARATGSGRSAVSIVMPCSYNSATRQVAALAGSPAWPARRERATASTVRPAAPQACGEPAPRQ